MRVRPTKGIPLSCRGLLLSEVKEVGQEVMAAGSGNHL